MLRSKKCEDTHLYTARLSASNCAWSIMFVFGDVGMLFSCILHCCVVLLVLLLWSDAASRVCMLVSSMRPMPSRRYSVPILLFGCWIFVFRCSATQFWRCKSVFPSFVSLCLSMWENVYVRASLGILNWLVMAMQFWCNDVKQMAISPKYRFILRWRTRLISHSIIANSYHFNTHRS